MKKPPTSRSRFHQENSPRGSKSKWTARFIWESQSPETRSNTKSQPSLSITRRTNLVRDSVVLFPLPASGEGLGVGSTPAHPLPHPSPQAERGVTTERTRTFDPDHGLITHY